MYRGEAIITPEKQFIFWDSHHKGFSQVPQMITSCIGLSCTEKAVYNYLAMRVFEQGQCTFPGISRVACAVNVTPNTVIKSIDRLVHFGFIYKQVRGNGKTNLYYLVELHLVDLLKVSENLWIVETRLREDDPLLKYKTIYEARVNVTRKLKSLGKEWTEFKDLGVNRLYEIIKQFVYGGVEDMDRILNSRAPDNVAKRVPEVGGAVLGDKPLEYSNMTDFARYFYSKYKEKIGTSHAVSNRKDAAYMKRVFEQLGQDKSKLLKAIDTFFELEFTTHTLNVFATSNTITDLERYLLDGTLPFYLKTTKQNNKVITPNNEYSDDKALTPEEFLAQFED